MLGHFVILKISSHRHSYRPHSLYESYHAVLSVSIKGVNNSDIMFVHHINDFRRDEIFGLVQYWEAVVTWRISTASIFFHFLKKSSAVLIRKSAWFNFNLFEQNALFWKRKFDQKWSFISKSNFAGSKVKRHANASRDYFFS